MQDIRQHHLQASSMHILLSKDRLRQKNLHGLQQINSKEG